jgi:hypothetical protein
MALELTGRIIQLMPEQTGTGKNGLWTKMEFVLETREQYPRKVCFAAWGDKVSAVKALKTGSLARVSFNAESREFNGKWYTDLKIWKIEPEEQDQQQFEQSAPPNDLEPLLPGEAEDITDNDLPF